MITDWEKGKKINKKHKNREQTSELTIEYTDKQQGEDMTTHIQTSKQFTEYGWK